MSVSNSGSLKNNQFKTPPSQGHAQLSTDKLKRLKKHINQTNRRVKFATFLSVIPFVGIIPSAMGRSSIGNASNSLDDFTDQDFNAISLSRKDFDEKIAGQVTKARGIQQVNLITEAAVGWWASPLHLLVSLPTNVVNWCKTGQLKKELRHIISEIHKKT